MIGRLSGSIHPVEPGLLIVDVGGVGYLVATSLRSFHGLAAGDTVTLWIHTQVRDDAIVLFGFPDRAELMAFQCLIAVAGVGPRSALAVLSTLSPGELGEVVESADLARLQRTPGVGRKTAERILLELRGRLSEIGGAPGGDTRADVVSALVNLGYSPRDARRAVDQGFEERPEAELGEVLRLALQHLTR